MRDPPGAKPGEHAPGDGGRGARVAPASAKDKPRRAHQREQPYASSNSNDDSSDSDFVLHVSRHSRRKAAAVAKKNPQASEANGNDMNKSMQPRANGKQRAKGPAPRGKQELTPFERKTLQLRDWTKRGVGTPMIMDIFSAVQRLARTPEEEQDGIYDHVYHVNNRAECTALHDALRKILVGRSFSLAKFSEWIEHTRLVVPEEQRSPSQVAQQETQPQRPWRRQDPPGWQPRPLTVAEREFLLDRDPASTTRASTAPLSSISRVLLQAVAEASSQSTLVGQLDGSISLTPAMSFRGQLGLISDITETFAIENAKFKKAIARMWYEGETNRLHFIMHSVADGNYWALRSIPILRRPVVLRRILTAGEQHPHECIDLSTYQTNVCNLGGHLSALDVWHAFSSLLGLTVVDVAPMSPDEDGIDDCTQFHVVFRSHGCPAPLMDKTCVEWQHPDGTIDFLWIHHIHFRATTPCLTCASATHTAKQCQYGGTRFENNIVRVSGVRLAIDQECARIGKAQNLEEQLLKSAATFQERSAMAAEDRDAPVVARPTAGKTIPNIYAPLGKAARVAEEARKTAEMRARRASATARKEAERRTRRALETARKARFKTALQCVRELDTMEPFRLWYGALKKDPLFPERTHRWHLPPPPADTFEDRLERFIRAATPTDELPTRHRKPQGEPLYVWTKTGRSAKTGRSLWTRTVSSLQAAVNASRVQQQADEVGSHSTTSVAPALPPSASQVVPETQFSINEETTNIPAFEKISRQTESVQEPDCEMEPPKLSGAKHERTPSIDISHSNPVTLHMEVDRTESLDGAVTVFLETESSIALLCPPRKSILFDVSKLAKGVHPTRAIMSALQAMTSPTHGLGNCLFVALLEGLINGTWKDVASICSGLFDQGLSDLKEVLYQAFIMDAARESKLCYRDLIHEQISPVFPCVDAYTSYMKRIRHSACEESAIIPTDTWGGSDAIRLFVKALGTRVYVIQHNGDPRLCSFLIYEQFTFTDGFRTGMHTSVPLTQWATDLGNQLRQGAEPIVLLHDQTHYSALILPSCEPTQRSPKRSARLRHVQDFPTPKAVDPYAAIEAIDLTEAENAETSVSQDSQQSGPPLQLSHVASVTLAQTLAEGGTRIPELLAFLEPTQLSPLDTQRQSRLDAAMAKISEQELSEMARSRGDTSIEGARRLCQHRLHAQLLEEQDEEKMSVLPALPSSDSSFVLNETGDSHSSSDSDFTSDRDVALAHGFHQAKASTQIVSAAGELHTLLQSPTQPDMALSALLGSPRAEHVAFQDIGKWERLFGLLPHNLDFMRVLYPPLRSRWGFHQLCVIRSTVLTFAIGQIGNSDVTKAKLELWVKDILLATNDAQRLAIQERQEQVHLLLSEVTPAEHRDWIRRLFDPRANALIARTALICGILAATPGCAGDLLQWAAVLFNAVLSSESTCRLISDDTSKEGLAAFLQWIKLHEQILVAGSQDSATRSWSSLGLSRAVRAA